MYKIRQDEQYLLYTLNDNSNFSLTAFRVLKKQEKNGLLSCWKLEENGHICLAYRISGMHVLSLEAETQKLPGLLSMMQQILEIVNVTRENGFLRVETIDTDISHMFFNPETGKVYLIALPLLSSREHSSVREWEMNLRKALLSMTELSQAEQGSKLETLKINLENVGESLKRLYDRIGRQMQDEKTELIYQEIEGEKLFLSLKNTENPQTFVINGQEYILGTDPEAADGVIDRTPTISRRHCRIRKEENYYYVSDLGSKNHTYLNGVLLEQGTEKKLEHGDCLKLSEYEFEVSIVRRL